MTNGKIPWLVTKVSLWRRRTYGTIRLSRCAAGKKFGKWMEKNKRKFCACVHTWKWAFTGRWCVGTSDRTTEEAGGSLVLFGMHTSWFSLRGSALFRRARRCCCCCWSCASWGSSWGPWGGPSSCGGCCLVGCWGACWANAADAWTPCGNRRGTNTGWLFKDLIRSGRHSSTTTGRWASCCAVSSCKLSTRGSSWCGDSWRVKWISWPGAKLSIVVGVVVIQPSGGVASTRVGAGAGAWP